MPTTYKKFLGLLLLVTSMSQASTQNSIEDPPSPLKIPSFDSLRPMNGINPADFDRFWERWTLVTVRFRRDSSEQRFIYANDQAIAAIKGSDNEFPDGSAFAKIAYVSEDDAEFPNSVEPVNFTRLQIMVKNEKKYTETDGWGYWLYVDGVKDIPANDHINQLACHACHRLVAERDYIFATPTFVVDTADWFGREGDLFASKFILRPPGQLSNFEQEIAKHTLRKPDSMRTLRMRLFTGSLHESIGPLSQFVNKDEIYALVDPMHKRFLVAEQLKPTSKCKKRVRILMSVHKKSNKKNKMPSQIKRGIVCNGVNRWIDQRS